MVIVLTILTFAFVLATIGVVVYAIYECTPLPRRSNPYRDSLTGRRRWKSPHLDDRG
jgi:hypothetical protein